MNEINSTNFIQQMHNSSQKQDKNTKKIIETSKENGTKIVFVGHDEIILSGQNVLKTMDQCFGKIK